jgi:acetylornithine/succinyldiaminopimelate/putrescine aminotransferase
MNAHPLIHLSTFGGSDLGCMAAIAAIELYEKLKPWDNAGMMGRRLRDGLERMVKGRRSAGTVRGSGLLQAIDMGTAEKARAFCHAAARRGLLVMPGAVDTSTVIFRPSLLITSIQVNAILEAAEKAAGAL